MMQVEGWVTGAGRNITARITTERVLLSVRKQSERNKPPGRTEREIEISKGETYVPSAVDTDVTAPRNALHLQLERVDVLGI